MRAALFVVLLLLFGCSATKRAQRHLNKARHHIEAAKRLDPSIKPQETVDTVLTTVITPETRVDTVFSTKVDSVVINKDRLVIRYRVKRDTVLLQATCQPDTIVVKTPIIKETYITPPSYSYKEFFKRVTGLSELWFWLIHLALMIVIFYRLTSRR